MSNPPTTCPTCQASLPAEARYCPECGYSLLKLPNMPAPPSPQWLGERRQVTVLFADLASFTAASEKADPEDVIDMLNTVFTRLMVECEKEGGYLDKIMGDAMMVLFGAPKAHEDDPARAVRAALAIQNAMHGLNSIMREKVGRACKISIGINTGSVVWGELGPKGKTALTVIGDTVNLAARLEDFAVGGQIIVSEAVYHRTKDFFEYEAIDPIAVRGKSGLISAYVPLQLRRKVQRRHDQTETNIPFVGREQKMDLLHAYWSRAGAGFSQIVLLTGEAGLGKTRLVTEFIKSMDLYNHEKRPLILRARHKSNAGHEYRPLADLIGQFFGMAENDTGVIRRRKIEDRAQVLGITSNKFLSLIGYLLGWYRQNEPEDQTEAKKQHNMNYLHVAAVDAAVDLFFKQSMRRPTLLVIDDLQWADPQVVEWLNRLIITSKMIDSDPGTYRLMVLTVSRPRFDAPLNTLQTENVIRLSPLSEANRRVLINHLLPGQGLPASLITRLSKESEGNPFYLQEVARELVQSGQLARHGNRWQLTRSVDQLDVPHSIEGLVLAKLDTLTPTDRRVLQHASVIGMLFSHHLLAKITPVENLNNSINNLIKQGLIKEIESAQSGRVYSFTQAVVREVTYNSILRKTRRELHELIVELAAEQSPKQAKDAETLAYNYAANGSDEKMIAYNWLAGRHALERFQFDVAFHHLQMAWDTLMEMSNPNPEVYHNLADALGDACTFTSHFTQAATCYQTAWSLIDNDPQKQAVLHYKLGRLHFYQANVSAALEDYQKALKTTAAHPNPELTAQIEAELRLMFDFG